MSEIISLTLPYPPSANRYWRSRVVKGISMTYVSAEAKAYKATVCGLAKIAGVNAPITGRVAFDIKLYPSRPQDWERRMKRSPDDWDDTVQCIDLDNANKVLLDALKGVAIGDDKWVRRITSERMEPDGEARLEVTITPIEPAAPQASLI